MYQRILIPVDGSPTSDQALQEALLFTNQQNVQLRLLHVKEEIHFADAESCINYAELPESIRSNDAEILTQAQIKVQQSGRTAEIQMLEADGESVAGVIIAEAQRWSADLIVIGTHGRTGFNRLLFGSVAEGVLRTSPVPILLIRAN
jgi:nucleotide-binding universal stress UspA family protein